MSVDQHYPFPEEGVALESPIQGNISVQIGAVRYSQTLGKLAEALSKAQLEFEAVVKSAENPAYKRGIKVSKYADLASVIDATRPALAKHGLVVIQLPQVNHQAKMLTMTTRLLHTSDEWIENDLIVPATQQGGRYDIQSIGSAMTYTRRYAWQAIVGVTAEEDDDGNAAAGVGSAEQQKEIAKSKMPEGYVPSLFYVHHAESDTYEITGSEELKSENRDVLKKFWSKTSGSLVCNGEQLEGLKYTFTERKVPFSLLKGK